MSTLKLPLVSTLKLPSVPSPSINCCCCYSSKGYSCHCYSSKVRKYNSFTQLSL
ncbi:hypothetical protein MANES_18G140797v8 [Manihot esculenta]|uniref:Uncharacterized protein n=1 Tax=Manihot esculenta TaxID=3983 RepID=A0ACB7G1W7_MANES|nr:hypothetical protein MANES_18G140797v8 [Manihot esculenta]